MRVEGGAGRNGVGNEASFIPKSWGVSKADRPMMPRKETSMGKELQL